ncbi:MAG TPA: hypothetical protein VL242_00730 [Sorangium sp.]|nr:hypothetical protein [Sorangium sp.]
MRRFSAILWVCHDEEEDVSDDRNERIEVLDEHPVVKDHAGRAVLQVALLVTVYFEDAY